MAAKSSAGTSGARGITYEARMCMLCFLRGYSQNLKDFTLEYQVHEAEKFDDIVFDEGGENYQLLQLKHKEKENILKITHSQFFSDKFNTDYNLLKYVKAFVTINSPANPSTTNPPPTNPPRFQNKNKIAVVITNIDFDLNNKNQLSLSKNPKSWYGGLNEITLNKVSYLPIFDFSQVYQSAKYYKFTGNDDITNILKNQAVTLVKDVGNITENEIKDALQYVIYAVAQPNDLELEKLIKAEMKSFFSLQKVDTIYDKLEKMMRKWCDTKLNENDQKQDVLSFKDAKEFFQKNVKNISFPKKMMSPISSFTGRTRELEEIREKFGDQRNLVISQSVAINGLGGIGKTELVKRFIQEYGQTDFCGRVIWIEAESDESVKNSFKQLADYLEIKSDNIQNLIEKVFKYFDGLKVLFVFDNFSSSSAGYQENLVNVCREYVNGLNEQDADLTCFLHQETENA